MDRPIHVVGGGIAGLVAAITAAEQGAPVVVHEAADVVGGRALGGTDRPGLNLGPHVVFTDGALARWMSSRDLPVQLRSYPLTKVGAVRLIDDSGVRRGFRDGLSLVATLRPREAPTDETFREWTEQVFDPKISALLCRVSGLFTFHHDPGSLSARFVWERYRRTIISSERIRWVSGGWCSVADALHRRAGELGVVVQTGERITPESLPETPVIVATSLASASRLLGRRLSWPGARTALLDVVTDASPEWPGIVADVRSDLETCCMVERETVVEPGLIGPGSELIQAHLGVAPGVGTEAGVARIEATLDQSMPGWRESVTWKRGHLVADSTGAVDLPGTTWRDRPAVDQGDARFLAGDQVAAPGWLSEVSVNSAVRAAHLALDARRRSVFSVGWPSVELAPSRRLAVLAAALPDRSVSTVSAGDWSLEPVEETGAGYRLSVRRGRLYGVAGEGDSVTLLSGRPGVRGMSRLVGRALLGLRYHRR